MEWLSDRVVDLSEFGRTHLPILSLALTAMMIAYLGKPVLAWSGCWLGRFPTVFRLPARAVVNLVLSGLVLLYVPDMLTTLLGLFNNLTLAPVLLLVILLSGMLADRYS